MFAERILDTSLSRPYSPPSPLSRADKRPYVLSKKKNCQNYPKKATKRPEWVTDRPLHTPSHGASHICFLVDRSRRFFFEKIFVFFSRRSERNGLNLINCTIKRANGRRRTVLSEHTPSRVRKFSYVGCLSPVCVQDTSKTQYVYPVGWLDRVGGFITRVLRSFDSILRSNNVEFVATVAVRTDSKTKREPTHKLKINFFNHRFVYWLLVLYNKNYMF